MEIIKDYAVDTSVSALERQYGISKAMVLYL